MKQSQSKRLLRYTRNDTGVFGFHQVMNMIQHDAQGVQFEWVFFLCLFDDV